MTCDNNIWHKPLSMQMHDYDYRAEEKRKKDRLHDTMQEYDCGIEALKSGKKKWYWEEVRE